MKLALKDLLLKTEPQYKGLLSIEWLTLGYVFVTSVLMLLFASRIENLGGMIILRTGALVLIMTGYTVYRRYPSKGTLFLRVAFQIAMLAFWYPDLYNFSRLFTNADHIIATLEQLVFGCQPAINFAENVTSHFLSECFYMGYLSYFPMIGILLMYYFFMRNKEFVPAATIVLGAFFTYYLVFLFVPVAGPQYYFHAIGLDAARAGEFAPVGLWFDNSLEMLDPPGWKDGLFYQALAVVRESERPVASFPSSHVGVSTIIMILAVRTRNKGLIGILFPLWVFLCCATIYIRAHYVVDIIAGFITAPTVLWLLSRPKVLGPISERPSAPESLNQE